MKRAACESTERTRRERSRDEYVAYDALKVAERLRDLVREGDVLMKISIKILQRSSAHDNTMLRMLSRFHKHKLAAAKGQHRFAGAEEEICRKTSVFDGFLGSRSRIFFAQEPTTPSRGDTGAHSGRAATAVEADAPARSRCEPCGRELL